MVRGGDEVRVRRYVRLTLDVRAQERLVEGSLQNVEALVADGADERGDVDFLLGLPRVLLGSRFRRALRRGGLSTPDDRVKLAHVHDLVQCVGRNNRAARLLDGGGEFDEHEAVEAEFGEARVERDLRARAA